MCNCVLCHMFNVNDHIDPSSMIVPTSIKCMLCEQSLKTTAMLICD